jgi:hypothetical protein
MTILSSACSDQTQGPALAPGLATALIGFDPGQEGRDHGLQERLRCGSQGWNRRVRELDADHRV